VTGSATASGKPDVALPVDSYRDAAPLLRLPFTANAVKFKLQTMFGGRKNPNGKGYADGEPPTAGLVVAYIDQRLVTERLNTVCPHLWQDAYELVTQNLLRCHLTIDGITRMDVGEGSGKGLYSDAFKRAGVKFGVGVSLYAVPRILLRHGTRNDQLKQWHGGLKLTDANIAHCRTLYQHWLETEGIKAFGGEPLDHGDAVDAQGDPADTDTENAERVPDDHPPDDSKPLTAAERLALNKTRLAAAIPDDLWNFWLAEEEATTPKRLTAEKAQRLHDRVEQEVRRGTR
jgi:hypothetical protein